MNTYKVKTPEGEMEVNSSKELTGVIICKNSRDGGWAVSLTSAKNVRGVLNRESKINRPWLSDWQVAEFEKMS